MEIAFERICNIIWRMTTTAAPTWSIVFGKQPVMKKTASLIIYTALEFKNGVATAETLRKSETTPPSDYIIRGDGDGDDEIEAHNMISETSTRITASEAQHNLIRDH